MPVIQSPAFSKQHKTTAVDAVWQTLSLVTDDGDRSCKGFVIACEQQVSPSTFPVGWHLSSGDTAGGRAGL